MSSYVLYVGGTGVFIFKTSSAMSGTPACNTTQEWAVQLNNPGGRAIMQQVSLAASLGKPVYVAGENVCGAWADRESVGYVYIGF